MCVSVRMYVCVPMRVCVSACMHECLCLCMWVRNVVWCGEVLHVLLGV